MNALIIPAFWVLVAGFASALLALVVAIRSRPDRPSRILVAAAVAPSTIVCLCFYTLALHMHSQLGAWPESIGDQGLSESVLTHAMIAKWCFGIVVIASACIWPLLTLVCVINRNWQRNLYYLKWYALASTAGLGLMLLAPSEFLRWWWD